MGSFWGHVDEGLFFIILAIWWLFNAFRDYIMAESKKEVMRPKIHYDVFIKRPIPLEIILKTLFPIVGFLGEFLDGGVRFQDEHGHFVKLIYQQHMTIYGLFVIHGVSDLMAWFKLPLYPAFNYMTILLAFLWYGVAFYYHASMHGKEPVETIVHVMPIYIMFTAVVAMLLEIKWKGGIWTTIVRSYCVLTLGTWFSHVAFMLYVHDKFPGGQRSNLDRSDPNNVTFAKAMFGLHLLANLLIILTIYVIVYVVMRIRLGTYITVPKYGQLVDEKYPRMNGYHRCSSKDHYNADHSLEDSSLLLITEHSIKDESI